MLNKNNYTHEGSQRDEKSYEEEVRHFSTVLSL